MYYYYYYYYYVLFIVLAFFCKYLQSPVQVSTWLGDH